MSNAEAVKAAVDDAFERDALPVLADYTRIPCLSPAFDRDWEANGHIAAAADLLASWARARTALAGATVEVVRLAGRTPVVLCDVPASGGRPDTGPALIYGHLDKQPPFGPWRAGLAPYEPVREDGRLYGRGTADDGYSLFSALLAIEAVRAGGGSHPRCVVLVEGSEESGSPDLPAYLDHLAGRLGSPGLVVCLDSGCATYDRLWLTTSLRGLMAFTLRVDVLTEGVHSGLAGGAVPSAFRLVRRLVSRLEDEASGELRLPELVAPVPPGRRAEIEDLCASLGEAARGSFPLVEGLELEGKDCADTVARRTWQASLAVTGIEGLPHPDSAGNVLVPSVTVKLALRLPPACDSRRAAAAVVRALEESPPAGARVTVAVEAAADGWQARPQPRWLEEAAREASVAFFGAPAQAIGEGGSIPFMAELGSRFGDAELLATGVLGPGSNAHGPNEFLHVAAAKSVTASVAGILEAYHRDRE